MDAHRRVKLLEQQRLILGYRPRLSLEGIPRP